MMFLNNVGKETLRLRLWFLLPLAGVMLLTVLSTVLAIRHHATADIEGNAEAAASHAEHLYREEIDNSASMLGAAMEVLAADQGLRRGLGQRDRTALLRRAAPVFAELRKKYSVTHFYFSDPQRVNILRVHQPARFGDTIRRETTLQAQRTGHASYGVELGSLGTFTLRLVAPWFAADGHVLGYVELGMEVDHVLRTVQHLGNVKSFVLIDKRFLDRREWEAGMRMLGRLPDWDRFPDVVVNNQATEELPQDLARGLRESLRADGTVIEPINGNASSYRAVFLPLQDAAGRSVGRVVLVLDVSTQVHELNKLVQSSLWVGGTAGATLLALFYALLGMVGRRLDRDRKRLHELALHDDLTGLYNHRMYYVRLDEEFIRRQRNGAPVSLLLLDIDYFKQVNDRYGHLAGDAALRTLGSLVMLSCRAMDVACRYGGEEIAVILPETDADSALVIAERLRREVELHRFDLGEGKTVDLTVSIGVSTSSDLVNTSSALTDSADRAMYRAKELGRNRVVCAATRALQPA